LRRPRKKSRNGAGAAIKGINILDASPRGVWFESAKGAECNSLGQRPRDATVSTPGALQARHGKPIWSQANADRLFRACSARELAGSFPGALPQAVAFRAFGALEPNPTGIALRWSAAVVGQAFLPVPSFWECAGYRHLAALRPGRSKRTPITLKWTLITPPSCRICCD
jgi:hypothetical protein